MNSKLCSSESNPLFANMGPLTVYIVAYCYLSVDTNWQENRGFRWIYELLPHFICSLWVLRSEAIFQEVYKEYGY